MLALAGGFAEARGLNDTFAAPAGLETAFLVEGGAGAALT